MTRLRAVVAVLCGLLAMTPGAAADDRAHDLQATVADFTGLVPGGVAVVTFHDGERSGAAVGLADANGRPMTTDTPFWAGLAAGPLAHVVALMLVEEDRLALDDLVETYLPEAPVGEGADGPRPVERPRGRAPKHERDTRALACRPRPVVDA